MKDEEGVGAREREQTCAGTRQERKAFLMIYRIEGYKSILGTLEADELAKLDLTKEREGLEQ